MSNNKNPVFDTNCVKHKIMKRVLYETLFKTHVIYWLNANKYTP